MYDFQYYTPTKVFFGKKAEAQAGSVIAAYGAKKVLLHYGGGSIKKSGLYQKVIDDLKTNGLEYCELGGVEPNPKIDLVRKGIQLCKKEGVDFILAVGGGSVIDSAKGICLGLANNCDDPWQMITEKTPPQKGFPLAVILTIAAAGSEMSFSHVITNPEVQLKRSLNHDLLRPIYAFMNPELTYTVSPYQTACGIVDIMMHTIERYFVPNYDTDLTDRIAEGLLVAVKNAGKAAMADPCDYEARATLMWASSLSHNGLTGCGKEYLFTAHRLEHDVSGIFDHVAHGAGLAVLFPALAQYIYKHDIRKFAQFAVRVWGIEMNFDHPEETALKGIFATKDFFASLGMPTTMAELGISPEDYEKIADKTTNNGTITVNSYQQLNKDDLIKIYKLAE